jgi:hypothetical protein
MHSIRILILSFLFLPVLGQIKPRLFEFGPKAGLLMNGIATLDTVTFKKKLSVGYQGGIFTRFNYGAFSLQPELVYQVKGGSTTAPTQAKYSYKYISTPLIVGYTPIKGIYFEAGYEPSWALNKGYKKDGLTIYGPDVATDKSLIVGTRINMLDMVSLFSLNIRYTHGLQNVSTSKQGLTPLDFRNRSVQLSVTYTFSEYYLWKKKFGVKKKN